MSEQNNGGPAFPCEQGHIPGGTWNQTFETGMTLRDYFAIHGDQPGMAEIVVAAGLTFSVFKVWEGEAVCLGTFDQWWSTVTQERRFELYATVRYLMADAMLKARTK